MVSVHRPARVPSALAIALAVLIPQLLADPRPSRAQSPPASMVISQVYSGGGTATAVFRSDFVELLNRGTTVVDLTGWSVQYAASLGSSWQKTALSGMIAPGQYFLVQEGSGVAGAALPTPDVTGTILLSATTGKVTLVNSNVLIMAGTGCPSGPSIVDFVGYGGTNCSQGPPAPRSPAPPRRSGPATGAWTRTRTPLTSPPVLPVLATGPRPPIPAGCRPARIACGHRGAPRGTDAEPPTRGSVV